MTENLVLFLKDDCQLRMARPLNDLIVTRGWNMRRGVPNIFLVWHRPPLRLHCAVLDH